MSDPIKPALAPEEWADVTNPDPTDVPLAVRLSWARNEMGRLDPTEHGLAALCLYGQSFGFTWHDVDSVMDITHEAGRVEAPTWALSLATRIAALLPPRPEKRWSFERGLATREKL